MNTAPTSRAPDAADAAPTTPPPAAPPTGRHRYARLKLLGVLLVCAAPAILSYLAYYVFPPVGRTNFGTLIEPQRPLPPLKLVDLDGRAQRVESLRGQWLLVQVDSGACDARCADKLYAQRQQRTMTGKERERIDRVWLVTDAAVPPASLLTDYEGTVVLRAEPAELAPLLPVDAGRRVEDYLYVVDPLGNLMMRFPADGEPSKIRKDIGRLLKASRVG